MCIRDSITGQRGIWYSNLNFAAYRDASRDGERGEGGEKRENYVPYFLYDLEYEALQAKFKFFKKRTGKKIITEQVLGQDRPEKTPPNVNLKRRDSESSADIDRQNQRLSHEI